MLKDDVLAVQSHYPQIYLACHTRHQRAKSNAFDVSGHDAALLSHLSEVDAVSSAALAKHLSVTPSTLSAAIKRLARLGYLRRERRADDRRRVDLFLTSRGRRAVGGASVLESRRVKRLLATLSVPERRRAVEGLGLLARAARSMNGG